MADCIVKSPISIDGERHEVGATVELDAATFVRLSKLGVVETVAADAARKRGEESVAAAKAAAEKAAADALAAAQAVEGAAAAEQARAQADAEARVKAEGRKTPTDPLAAMLAQPAAAAIEAISAVDNIDDLMKLFELESDGKERATVLAALERREEDLGAAAKAAAEKAGA